jgi:hypothetical protein
MQEERETELLRNEASLNFVSLRSHFNSVRRRGMSRVEMNALRAPLTSLYVAAEMEIVFSLDTADAFIDGRLMRTSQAIGSKSVDLRRRLASCWKHIRQGAGWQRIT